MSIESTHKQQETNSHPTPQVQLDTPEIIKKDLVIIGSGPAGMSCALYAKRALLDCIILEKESVGGQMIVTDMIDNYLGIPHANGYELAEQMKAHVKEFGVELSMERASEIIQHEAQSSENAPYFEVKTSKHTYHATCVLIACGATAKEAEFKGESTYTGHGISYCATCDAMFYRGKDVYVVGGGNSACEEGLFLARFAKSVTLLVRRDTLRAQESFVQQLHEAENVTIAYNTKIKEVSGETSDAFTRIVLENTKDHSLETITCAPHEIGIFVFAGRKPMSTLVGSLVESDDKGFIITNDRMETKTPGLFAAGDVRSKGLRQLITAASDGAVAGTAAATYVRNLKREQLKRAQQQR